MEDIHYLEQQPNKETSKQDTYAIHLIEHVPFVLKAQVFTVELWV